MNENKLPSVFQIGDRVAQCKNGTVIGVSFYEGKVLYDVEFEEDDGYKYHVQYDSIDIIKAINE